MVTSSCTPAISWPKRTQRVQWMQRVMSVETSGPRSWSATTRLRSAKRATSRPKPMARSCSSHSPPWSQIGQSSGWLMSRNSMVAFWAPMARGDFVKTFMPGVTGVAQAGSGFGAFSTSTRHMRQLAATDSFSW
jgi:hypothetical protein